MGKFNYFLNKEERSNAAREHTKRMDEIYVYNTQDSVKRTVMYDGSHIESPITSVYNGDTEFVFRNTDTVTALFNEKKENTGCEKYAVLNFASFKNPGGRFLDGSSAQEECLCHESNLYNILVNFKDSFYIPNKSRLNNSLYDDHLLYTPDVIFDRGESMKCTADVITCAAPNKTAAQKYRDIPDDKVDEALISRVHSVLMSAYCQSTDGIILGAFGCGVFGNDIKTLAIIYRGLFDHKYKRCFKRVVFAIPTLKDGDDTFDKFIASFTMRIGHPPFDITERVYYGKYGKRI